MLRLGICSFFQWFSYSILIFLTFPLNRQIEMLVFSCSGMRSHFLHVTFKVPALSNTQASPGSGLVCLLQVSSLKQGRGKKNLALASETN